MIKRVLLTRPELRIAETSGQLAGLDVIASPLLKIVPSGILPDLTGCQAVLFTSHSAVDRMREETESHNLPAYCVGSATANSAREAGFQAFSADGDVAALIRLAEQRIEPENGWLLYPRGVHKAGKLAERLDEHAAEHE